MARQDTDDRSGDEYMPLFLFALVVGGVLGVSWLFWPQIVWASMGLDLAQLWVVERLGLATDLDRRALDLARDYLTGYEDPGDAPYEHLRGISAVAGDKTRWVVGGIVLALAALVYVRLGGRPGRTVRSLYGGRGPSFVAYQADHWKTVLPATSMDVTDDDPALDRAQRPPVWLRERGIALGPSGLDVDAATAALEAQLGNQWKGFAEAPLHVQAILLTMAQHGAYGQEDEDMEEAFAKGRRMKDELAVIHWSLPAGAVRDKALQKFVDTHNRGKVAFGVEREAAFHGWVTTVVLRMLMFSRSRYGIVAANEFLWLKQVDRNLWYAVQNLGRRAHFIEGAGAIAHYQAEIVAGGPMLKPRVDEAVEGLVAYLEEWAVTDLDRYFEDQKREEGRDTDILLSDVEEADRRRYEEAQKARTAKDAAALRKSKVKSVV